MGTLLSSCHVRLWPIKSMGAGNITPAWESIGWESIGCILRVLPHRPFDRQPPTSTAQPGAASAHRPELHQGKMRSAKKRGGEAGRTAPVVLLVATVMLPGWAATQDALHGLQRVLLCSC